MSDQELDRRVEEFLRKLAGIDKIAHSRVSRDEECKNLVRTAIKLFWEYQKAGDAELRREIGIKLGEVLHILHTKHRFSYTIIDAMGIPKATAQRLIKKYQEYASGDAYVNTGESSSNAGKTLSKSHYLEHALGKLLMRHSVDEIYWYAMLGKRIVEKLRDVGIDIPRSVPIPQADRSAEQFSDMFINMLVTSRREYVITLKKLEFFRNVLLRLLEMYSTIIDVVKHARDRVLRVVEVLRRVRTNIEMVLNTVDGDPTLQTVLENLKDDIDRAIKHVTTS